MLLCGCGKKEEPDLGVWEMPKVDAAPTAQPKDVPSWGGGSAEKYVWNEATGINMADPGVNRYIEPTNMSHAETLALFGGQFMPMTIFNESYGSYERMYLEQVRHDVLLEDDGSLAENSYIEYRYLN